MFLRKFSAKMVLFWRNKRLKYLEKFKGSRFLFYFAKNQSQNSATTYNHHFITCLNRVVCSMDYTELDHIFSKSAEWTKKEKNSEEGFLDHLKALLKKTLSNFLNIMYSKILIRRDFQVEKVTLLIADKFAIYYFTFVFGS